MFGKKFNIGYFYNISLSILFLVFIILLFRYQSFLINYRVWEDESETIVTAKMMVASMALYSDIFNHHGPLTFLPGVILETFGSFSITEHRLMIAFFQIITLFSIYKTPILEHTFQRVLASMISATIMVSFLPEIFGHMYKY